MTDEREPQPPGEAVDIERLQKLWEASTQGARIVRAGSVVEILYRDKDGAWRLATYKEFHGNDRANAECDAAAHNAMPALLHELRTSRQTLAERESEIERLKAERDKAVDGVILGGTKAALELIEDREDARDRVLDLSKQLAAAQEREKEMRAEISNLQATIDEYL